MARRVEFDETALSGLKSGVELLAKAVKVTLGPKGRNVLLHREIGSPHVTKDGISVAKEIESIIPTEQMAIDLIKEAANNTLENAGDGTTSTTVLTEAIFIKAVGKLNKKRNSMFRRLLNYLLPKRFPLVKGGSNAMDIKRGIDLATEEVISRLKLSARRVNSSSDIFNIATVSANNDKEIGKLIEEAIQKVGKEGVIQTEDSKDHMSSIKLVEGMQLDRGFFSKDFLDKPEDSFVEYDNPKFFIYNGTLSSVNDLIRTVELAIQTELPLVIVADDFESQVVRFLLTNKMRSNAKIVLMKAPGMGDQKTEILKDLAALTNCNTLNLEGKYNSLSVDDLGSAIKIRLSKYKTTISSDNRSLDLVRDRIRTLKQEIVDCDMETIRTKLEKRLAQLEGKLAIIYIGAFTEVELREKKDRVDDALSATKSAIQEGIIAGAGLTLLRISKAMENTYPSSNKDIMKGYEAVMEAIRVPAITIIDNAGLNSKEIVGKILSEGTVNYGFNSLTEKFEDLLDSGIIDPVKVTRLAIQNSGSVAGMLITTGCVVSKYKE